MYMKYQIDDSGAALARYRTVLCDAFDPRSFARFYSDELDSPLGRDVNEEVDFTALLHDTLVECRQHGTNLRRLLVRALRHRAARLPLVDVFASALGLGPVVEVAGVLTDRGCPSELREQIALAFDETNGAHRIVRHRGGREAWLDVLVWLEELPERMRPRPPLIDYLERIEHAWRCTDEIAAAELGRWLTEQRRARSIGPRTSSLTTSPMRGVLLDFNDNGTVWTCTAYVFGDDRSAMLFQDTLVPPSTEQEVSTAVARAADRCLADRAVAPLLAAGTELRFDLVLPNRWIWLPVDQVQVGANELDDVPPTRLGISHPVVVRPRSWWRPTPGTASYGTILRRFKNKRDHLREGKAVEIRTLDCPTRWTPDDLEIINESPAVVGIALACDRTTTASPDKLVRCLRAHVLAIVWKRSGVAIGDGAEGMNLAALLDPIEDAPRIVREHRLQQRRADLSLIWHVDPVELPDREPFGPPEFA